MTKILDGKSLSRKIISEIKEKHAAIKKTRPAGLACILVGENPASKVYVSIKAKRCKEIGFKSKIIELPRETTAKTLLHCIQKLNEDPAIDGILLQQPLPTHLEPEPFLAAISPEKDVDGFHPYNQGLLAKGILSGFLPCTPKGIHRLLREYKIDLNGRHAVILGRSFVVGKPLANLLSINHSHYNATTTLMHSKSRNAKNIMLQADVLISAIGSPEIIKADMVKPGSVVIDVGISRTSEGLIGDVDYHHVAKKTSFITPVPGGVGPMTIAMLLENTYHAFCKKTHV